jgi:hypothetical protein
MHQPSVTLKSWTTASGKAGTGAALPLPDLLIGAYDDTGMLQPPHVRGQPSDVEIVVDYITPRWSNATGSGGFTPQQLVPPDQGSGFAFLYVIGWAGGPRTYIVTPRGLDTSKPLHYTLYLQATDRKVPF